ncbi:MAG: hypothetical protein HYY16_02695 [Planctomycetes bacterium]|nr:hypothetical protein [Planctomycetota bacterium]
MTLHKSRFVPAIRGMQEARDALAEVLEMTVRRMQIIVIMQKIMICRTPDTRRFLGDAMAGLIEGGLDYMRKRRREAIEALQRRQGAEQEKKVAVPEAPRRQEHEDLEAKIRAAIEAKRLERARKAEVEFEPMEVVESEPIQAGVALPEEGVGVTIPEEKPAPAPPAPAPAATETGLLPSAEELKEIEDLGTELDALSLAAVAREIFPDLKGTYEPWEVGRAIYMNEQLARDAVLQGARLRDHERATMLAPALDQMKRLIENHRPWWASSLPAIRECIDAHFAAVPARDGGATAQHLFDVIAMADPRAVEMLRLIAKTNEPGVVFVADLRKKLEKLMAIEEKRGD